MAEAVWAATWPVERIRQRAFFTFGMDLLLSLNLFQVGGVGRPWGGAGVELNRQRAFFILGGRGQSHAAD